MPAADGSGELSHKKPGRRWFIVFGPTSTTPSTWSEVLFDLGFGIVCPLIFIAFDPLILRDRGGLVYGAFSLMLFCVLEMGVLGVWLLFGKWLHGLAGYLGGVLLLGAPVAYLFACLFLLHPGMLIVLAPFTFCTGYAYQRNAGRAFYQAKTHRGVLVCVLSGLIGAAVVFGAPVTVHIAIAQYVPHLTEKVLRSPTPESERAAVEELRWACHLGYGREAARRLREAADQESDPVRKENLGGIYFHVRGYYWHLPSTDNSP